MLIKNGFKEISEKDFSTKLKTHFGINISEQNSTILLHNEKEYDIDVKNKFIDTYPFEHYYIEEFVIQEGLENEYNKKFVLYNKIIFNDDISSITSILHDKQSREDIYFYFDYEKNTMLNQLSLRDINYNNFEPDYIQHLFLYNNQDSSTTKTHIVSHIVKNHSKEIDDYFLNVIETIFNYWEHIKFEANHKYQLIALLIEKLLEKNHQQKDEEKSRALIKYIYSMYENLENHFIKEEYFENLLLKNYSVEYFEAFE